MSEPKLTVAGLIKLLQELPEEVMGWQVVLDHEIEYTVAIDIHPNVYTEELLIVSESQEDDE